jgi:hypothetical protein
MPKSFNKDQKALLEWICAGLSIPGVVSGAGDSKYLLSNMIAKIAAASDEYHLSLSAENVLRDQGADLNDAYKRSRYYGKKSPFIYEHPVPASVIRSEILSSASNRSRVREILSAETPVAVITREENKTLDSLKLKNKMPDDWRFGDSVWARYRVAGIIMSDVRLKVTGAIKR